VTIQSHHVGGFTIVSHRRVLNHEVTSSQFTCIEVDCFDLLVCFCRVAARKSIGSAQNILVYLPADRQVRKTASCETSDQVFRVRLLSLARF
jgi:hypothetical protein